MNVNSERNDEEVALNIAEIHSFMNKQYSSFRYAWITFKIPQIVTGMLIFSFVLIELIIRILLN